MQVPQVASNCQALHDIQIDDPAAEKLPDSQSEQLVEPSSAEYLPAAQIKQEAPPEFGAYVPGWHFPQLDAPVLDTDPTPHSMHFRAPSESEYLPASQATQSIPLFSNFPIGHKEHEEEASRDTEPAAQLVHDDEPSVE
jgi:hypothetical protein